VDKKEYDADLRRLNMINYEKILDRINRNYRIKFNYIKYPLYPVKYPLYPVNLVKKKIILNQKNQSESASKK